MNKIYVIPYGLVAFVIGITLSGAYAIDNHFITPNLDSCQTGQYLQGFNIDGSLKCSILRSNGTGTILPQDNIDVTNYTPLKKTIGSTLADLENATKENHGAGVNTFYGVINLKGNLQPPRPNPGEINIRVEPETNELQASDNNGRVITLNKSTVYYFGFSNAGYKQLGYSAPNIPPIPGKGYFSTNPSDVRLAISQGGTLSNFQCNILNNSMNGITKISVDVNGGTVYQINVGPNVWGTHFTNGNDVNFNPGSQLYFKYDSTASTSGLISAICQVEIR